MLRGTSSQKGAVAVIAKICDRDAQQGVAAGLSERLGLIVFTTNALDTVRLRSAVSVRRVVVERRKPDRAHRLLPFDVTTVRTQGN